MDKEIEKLRTQEVIADEAIAVLETKIAAIQRLRSPSVDPKSLAFIEGGLCVRLEAIIAEKEANSRALIKLLEKVDKQY